ncbi:hypothetical protein B0T14DRAFT_298821 [Immersiella caudata]|uniref:Uncharacterized protein n=1 Tax=Immersiella caudata TaxID=314043 RepID=A0AA39WF21_9PEZI|nr:hypothetical protein B0T14DRAFT_298821 [Immersiella caudata]
MPISEAHTRGKLGNNVGVILSSGMFVSGGRNVAVQAGCLDAWRSLQKASDVRGDSRTCFMPSLRPFQKKSSGTRTNCKSGSHGPLQQLHPALARLSPQRASGCRDNFPVSDATTVCSPDFPRSWVPVPRRSPKGGWSPQCRDFARRLIVRILSAEASCHLTSGSRERVQGTTRHGTKPASRRARCAASCLLPIRPQKIGVCQAFASFAIRLDVCIRPGH